MSFDLFLQAFESGGPAQVDRNKVVSVLRRHCPDTADDFGFYLVQFPDGSDVEFSAKGLESDSEFTGCAFHVRGFSPHIIGFVFDVAKIGGMVILNAQGADTIVNPTTILTDQHQAAHVPSSLGKEAVLCSSPEHLAELLGTGFGNWKAYRDLIVGRN